jgi:transcriptional regulator with XRE-family HTH domain
MESGKWIRFLREELVLKPSDIERITRNIAKKKGNPNFYVSHSTLSDIEAGSIPSIHKLFSLAICLRVTLKGLLFPFDIDSDEVPSSQLELENEGLVQISLAPSQPFKFQLNFDVNHSSEKTNFLRFPPQGADKLPSFFRSALDPLRYRYAVIGSRDDAMSDLLPPRSLVEIDTAQTTVQVFPWRTIRERPVYLIWHTDGHTCCWCQVDGRELTTVPYPLSRQPVRRFRMPGQASIVGRVTNAWMPFGSDQFQSSAPSS